MWPSSARQGMDDNGQMASTICVDESTRLSTKLTLRSLWRVNAGGHPDLEIVLEEVRLGFWRIAGGTSCEACDVCLGHAFASCTRSQESSERSELKHLSEESEVKAEMEVSSECWEEASDQTEAEDDDAEEAREGLYGPLGKELM